MTSLLAGFPAPAWIGGFGAPELLFLLFVLAVIFGARRLPEIGRGLGEGIKNFRGAMKELSSSEDDAKKKNSES